MFFQQFIRGIPFLLRYGGILSKKKVHIRSMNLLSIGKPGKIYKSRLYSPVTTKKKILL